MRKKRDVQIKPKPADWRVSKSVKLEGKRYELVKGREFKVKGARGVFRFYEYVETDGGEVWVTAYGGPAHMGIWRSFHPDRIKWISKKVNRAG